MKKSTLALLIVVGVIVLLLVGFAVAARLSIGSLPAAGMNI